MKTYDERSQMVASKLKKLKIRRAAIKTSGFVLVMSILALVLFVPFNNQAPTMTMYAGSEYYPLIQRLSDLTWHKPQYNNNFELLMGNLAGMNKDLTNGFPMEAIPGDAPTADENLNTGMNGTGNYVEVTDNQVAGVTEADLIKRSDKYIYYLSDESFLCIYSINKEASDYVGGVNVVEMILPGGPTQTTWRWYASNTQMYLSKDCTTVTVIMDFYEKEMGAGVLLVNLDVTDPENIRLVDHVFFNGSLLSSRVVEGDLLLTYQYRIDTRNMDFDDPATFVPTYGKPGQMECIPGSDILCSDHANQTLYTVICKLDGKTLQVQDTAALLSYSTDLYVSGDTIYATHTYTDSTETKDGRMSVTMTDITGISYTGESLEKLGTVTVDGSVKDQYSMDQHNGILRVVTSTTQTLSRNQSFSGEPISFLRDRKRNVNLYCVDLTDWAVEASVIAFAPDGEEATAVRFNGDYAYVCTAEVFTLTDPVYFFDLSDLSDITWTDTGIIDGYSTSLIDLGDGYLAGIGFNENRMLKVEIYKEVETGVESVSSFELEAEFSQVYKSYLINRDQDLIGLAVFDYAEGYRYILLHFDGYQLREFTSIALDGHMDLGRVRAVIVEDHLYLLQPNKIDITAHKVW